MGKDVKFLFWSSIAPLHSNDITLLSQISLATKNVYNFTDFYWWLILYFFMPRPVFSEVLNVSSPETEAARREETLWVVLCVKIGMFNVIRMRCHLRLNSPSTKNVTLTLWPTVAPSPNLNASKWGHSLHHADGCLILSTRTEAASKDMVTVSRAQLSKTWSHSHFVWF